MGEFIVQLSTFMNERKRFWLLPIIITLATLSGLLVFKSGPMVDPLTYTLF